VRRDTQAVLGPSDGDRGLGHPVVARGQRRLLYVATYAVRCTVKPAQHPDRARYEGYRSR